MREEMQGPDTNRALDVRRDGAAEPSRSVSLVDVDRAILHQFRERFDVHVEQAGARLRVPVIFDKPERWRWAANQDVKSAGDRILYPLIVIKRGSLDTDAPDNPNKRLFTMAADGGQFVATQRWSEQNRKDNFAVLTGRVPVEKRYVVRVPKYLDISYDCTIFTEYQIQANRLVEQISYEGRAYWGDPSEWLFWCEASGFSGEVEEEDGKTRFVRTTFSVQVKGYILPESSLGRDTLAKSFTTARAVIEERVVTDIDEAIRRRGGDGA